MLFAATAFAASDRTWSAGVLGGMVFNELPASRLAVTGSFFSVSGPGDSARFAGGPALRVNLPGNFRVETDMLYRRYTVASLVAGNPFAAGGAVPVAAPASINARVGQWRFPMMMQYRAGHRRIVPFFGGGLSVERLSEINGAGLLAKATHAGVVAGGGADVKIPHARLSAEFRYTHVESGGSGEFLVGVHF